MVKDVMVEDVMVEDVMVEDVMVEDVMFQDVMFQETTSRSRRTASPGSRGITASPHRWHRWHRWDCYRAAPRQMSMLAVVQ